MPKSRLEYPRPQLVRADWLNLNGMWAFEFDDTNRGLRESWYKAHPYNNQIIVPFAYQTPHSGIFNREFHDIAWYQRGFDVPADWAGRRILLRFGAVDYRAWVWVNGQFAVYHEGGSTAFAADITDYLRSDVSQVVTVRIEDFSADKSQPRGKQYWEVESASIFYTRTSGIWQTVWLEPVDKVHLTRLKITPDLDARGVHFGYFTAGDEVNVSIETQIRLNGKIIHTRTHDAADQTFTLEGDDLVLWSPETPNLYDVTVKMSYGDTVTDSVESYFGMRKIAVQNGRVMLNNQPYMMRLVLDQGYHPDSLLTFPSDDTIKADIEVTKAMGFNGARKHQKVEEPRYLYWADKLGLLVWGEMANSYLYNERAVRQLTNEWHDVIARDYNHPCIVAWVPVNESWGVPDIPNDRRQTDWLIALYYLTKALDSTRLVISNDGWEHAKSDLLTIHDYTGEEAELRERYSTIDKALQWRPANKALLAPGIDYGGEPVLVTEFGGIAFPVGREGWGYTTATDEESFLRQLRAVFQPMHDSALVQGFCYTQLTDVEQEINGLLTYDRKPKADIEAIRKIVTGEA